MIHILKCMLMVSLFRKLTFQKIVNMMFFRNHPFYMLIGLGVHSNISDDVEDGELVVDYIRVYALNNGTVFEFSG